jgi:hypothetical protein
MKSMRAHCVRHGATALLVVAAAALLSACASVSDGTGRSPVTYYVSPSGNDAAAGTSPATAWRTLGRASSAGLAPGTKLLLQAGSVFTGQLTVWPHDAGSASDPVLIGSYGGGDATIYSPDGSGVLVYDTGGVDISGLRLTGSPHDGEGDGVNVYSDLPAGHRLDHIDISNVDASGFLYGIALGSLHSGAGFSNVAISDANLHDNMNAGLLTYGPPFNPQAPAYSNQNVVVSQVQASMNHGNPHVENLDTGNGIVLGSVDAGSVVWSTADDNGGLGPSSEGPVGIWTYDSTDIDIEHDLSYGNKTLNQVDGNGFGLDQNTSDSVLEYDISYGNDGAGYLIYSKQDDGWQRDNVVRDNISSGDGRDGTTFYGGMSVLGYVSNTAVYQNTIVMTPARAGAPPLLRLGPDLHGVSIRNNLFSTESGPVVCVSSALPESAVLLQGNDYFSVLGPWQVVWGQKTYSSLAEWRMGTSEETANSQPTGLAADPEMVGPVLGLSVESPVAPAAAEAFALRPNSPLIGAGLDLVSLGMHPAAIGYTGQPQPVQHPDIGAV